MLTLRRAARLINSDPKAILFVTSLLRMREIKIASGLRRAGWKVILIYMRTTPFRPGAHFDVVLRAETEDQAHAYAKALGPRICHVFSGAVDGLLLRLCRDKPGPVIVDLNDIFCPALFDYCHERFEPTRECLERATALCARDLQAKRAERTDGFKLPRHKLLFPEYGWQHGVVGKGREAKCDSEVRVVSVGTFCLEKLGMCDSGYLQLARMLTEQRIHLHIYPHWFYLKRSGSSFNWDLKNDFADFFALQERTEYLHVHDSLPVEELARVLPQYDFGIVSGGCAALGQKLQLLKPEYMESCYSGRIADYLDARLPVLINREVGFNFRLLKRYGLAVDLAGVLSPGFREKLLAIKRDHGQVTRVEAAAQVLSLDRNITRLAAFYNRIMEDDRGMRVRLGYWWSMARNTPLIGRRFRQLEAATQALNETASALRWDLDAGKKQLNRAQRLLEVDNAERARTQVMLDVEKVERERIQRLLDAARAETEQTRTLLNIEKGEKERTQVLLDVETVERERIQRLLDAARAETEQTRTLLNTEKAEKERTQVLLDVEKVERGRIQRLLDAARVETEQTRRLLNIEKAEKERTQELLSADTAESARTQELLDTERTAGEHMRRLLEAERTEGERKQTLLEALQWQLIGQRLHKSFENARLRVDVEKSSRSAMDELAGLLNWPDILDDVERKNGMPELMEMMQLFLRASGPLRDTSSCWDVLSFKNFNQLLRDGYRNFKRTIGCNYFNFLVQRGDPQIAYLESNLDPVECRRCEQAADALPDDSDFNWHDQKSYRYFVLLLWDYARTVDVKGYLEQLEEPSEGNPLVVPWAGKQVSQDLANSVIEYYSMSEEVAFEKCQRVLEIGGGYGRDAYVILTLNPQIQYTLVDVPPALFVAQRYLSSVLRDRSVFQVREFGSYEQVREEMDQASIVCLLPHQLDLLPPGRFDLSFNISSFGEMRPKQIKAYFDTLERVTKGYFYMKQWKVSRNAFDHLVLTEDDYPISPRWSKVYSRVCRVQVDFFESLYRVIGQES